MLMITFSHQMNPLYEAASRGDIDVVRYLCDKGADPNIQNNSGVSK